MIDLATIKSPVLIIDRQKTLRNISRMLAKTQGTPTVFRPHFKTHQSAGIGEWFRELGVNKITVSSIDMAVYFESHGWKDITLAFPVNIREYRRIDQLAHSIRLSLIADNEGSVDLLARKLTQTVHLWIEIDVGDNRSGVWWEDREKILQLAQKITASEKLQFGGLFTHSGYTYRAGSVSDIKKIYEKTLGIMQGLKSFLGEKGYSDIRISLGDTPSCSLVDQFGDVDEIRPGNFVFYDLMQLNLGSCSADDISVALACPVVSIQPQRQEIVIHGGAVHLSKDFLTNDRGERSFGAIAMPEGEGWGNLLDNTFIRSISQEHGVVKVSPDHLSKIKIGDIVLVIPVHSCLCADLHAAFQVIDPAAGDHRPNTHLEKLTINHE